MSGLLRRKRLTLGATLESARDVSRTEGLQFVTKTWRTAAVMHLASSVSFLACAAARPSAAPARAPAALFAHRSPSSGSRDSGNARGLRATRVASG